MTLLPGTDSDEFATLSDKLEPVSEVLHLAAAPDFQLRVACRDTAELDGVLRTLRRKLGVADTETKIILRSGPPPVEAPRETAANSRVNPGASQRPQTRAAPGS